jgi:ectoine hydroxylase-related dioxygenase (phytanoyl-CoA dioxygenase family)
VFARWFGSPTAREADRFAVFAAATAQDKVMRRAMARYGCLVLRGLFHPDALARIRERADSLARGWDDRIERGDTQDIADYITTSAFQAGHLPEKLIGADETWSDLTTNSPFDRIVKAVFGNWGRDYALRRSTLQGTQNPVPFHQDAAFMGLAPTYNFWTPLQDVGVDAAGLGVIVGSGAPIIKEGYDNAEVPAYIARRYGEQSYWAPELNAGDVLVFTSMMFHRTHSSAQMRKTRYSLELRGAVKDRTLAIAGVPADWNEIKMLPDVPA